jgi:hypothetical protein
VHGDRRLTVRLRKRLLPILQIRSRNPGGAVAQFVHLLCGQLLTLPREASLILHLTKARETRSDAMRGQAQGAVDAIASRHRGQQLPVAQAFHDLDSEGSKSLSVA